jgi:AcrR family transcriptional regulator
MDAFWELYSQKRLEKITVREITARAGYNRGTFYEYFADVYAVLEHIEASLLPDLSDMPPLACSDEDAVLSADSFIKLYENGKQYYPVLLGDNGDPAFARKMKNGIKCKLLEQMGEPAKKDVKVDYALELMLSAMIGILTYWFRNNENLPKEELVKLVYEIMSGDGLGGLAQKLKL